MLGAKAPGGILAFDGDVLKHILIEVLNFPSETSFRRLWEVTLADLPPALAGGFKTQNPLIT